MLYFYRNYNYFHSTDSEKGKDYHSITGSPYSSSGSVTDDAILSKVARTHTFKRLRTPSRCRGCDTYVYFHGFECEIVRLNNVLIHIHAHVHVLIIFACTMYDVNFHFYYSLPLVWFILS